MPFGLKLKRTRRYNVSSKNCFVTQILLLDGKSMECTLSVESTGQECLEAVAQRLELRELTCFGLWYLNKQHQVRWVDLEKPLKKQLDKAALEAMLHFGVMFYVPSEDQLQQDVTRNQYYLQLKKDILEGRLPCSVDQGVQLAALSVQADFGDVDQYESQEFLRECVLFPLGSSSDEYLCEEMILKVAAIHQKLRTLQPSQAEMLYIREVKKLDGYGRDDFSAKDVAGTDITLQTTFHEILIKYKNDKPPHQLKWADVSNVAHNKCFVCLEIQGKEETLQLQMDDIETAKYIWRVFGLKQKFYRLNKNLVDTVPYSSPLLLEGKRKHSVFSAYMQMQKTSPSLFRRHSMQTRLSMRQQPIIVPPVQMQGGEGYMEPHLSSQDNIHLGLQQDSLFFRSQTSLDRVGPDYSGLQAQNGSVYSTPSLTSLLAQPTIYLPQRSPVSSDTSLAGSDCLVPVRVDYVPNHRHSAIVVPSYRPTPDYETVVRQLRSGEVGPLYSGGGVGGARERNSRSLRSLNLGSAHAYMRPAEGLVYSQPEIREPPPQYTGQAPRYAFQSQGHTATRPLRSHLSSQSQRVAPTHHQRTGAPSGLPPPPYPQPRPAASTPNLTLQQRAGGSNPDLAARRVLHAVQTFQEDSLPVVHRSLLEVSEPLQRFRGVRKRNSLGAVPHVGPMPGLTLDMDSLALGRRGETGDANVFPVPPPTHQAIPQTISAPPQPNGLPPQPPGAQSSASVQPPPPPTYNHNKSLSNATMLIHSSESEGEGDGDGEQEEQNGGFDVTAGQTALSEAQYNARLQAALAQIPRHPPPQYPGHTALPRRFSNELPPISPMPPSPQMLRFPVGVAIPPGGMMPWSGETRMNSGGASSLVPCLSEPDLMAAVKERVRTEPPRERPVSELYSVTDNIVETEFLLRSMEKKRVSTADAKKLGPLKMAMMNGLSISAVPLPEESKDETSLTPGIPLDNRCKQLESRIDQGTVLMEFEQVPKRLVGARCDTAQLSDNVERNRFRDVLPYEGNRVQLVTSKDNPTGYINASHIQMDIAGEHWNYIATQGPLAGTCQDFWQMVWEEGVNVIAMVTAEEEGGKQKCHRYWPKLGSRHSSVTYGHYKVTTRFCTDYGRYATTGLKLKHLPDGPERTVWHLQYTDWPDHGCPEDIPGFLDYLEEIKSVRRHTNNTQELGRLGDPPVVVHCSAGVGRTGVVILTELMIACLEHNECQDVPEVLSMLRERRAFVVQTISQYTFVYRVLMQFLKNSRLI
uniref:tyrosine-protein phosphatase non-receptor type 21-like isoform X2 n=1 Tax=Myxine glutinosa TaxID=7769 RepID=UPI00358EE77B